MFSSDNREILIIKARETIGKILYSVITASITPFEATKYFPKNVEDPSVKVAWHALLHFDADEDIRKDNPDFAQEQIAYIEMLAKILSKGEALPENILEEYEELYMDTVLPKNYNWFGKLKSFFRFIN